MIFSGSRERDARRTAGPRRLYAMLYEMQFSMEEEKEEERELVTV
jgi:hypothetical protein